MSKAFTNGSFWLENAQNEDDTHLLDIFHQCETLSPFHNILLEGWVLHPTEIHDRKCHFCGEIDIPDDIYTLWVLSKK